MLAALRPRYRRIHAGRQTSFAAGLSGFPYVAILRILGLVLFGTTEQLMEATARLDSFFPVFIVGLRNMTCG